uniref:Small nuclear ribonucleoprotein 48 (U11/U12) n=2 Tax=Paramormyrops kingsleyae TaxID=1676925 RepID=A0A3B3SVQ7_9TELE
MEISEVTQCREKSLQDLTEFTESCRKKLSEIFEALGWSQTLDTDPAEDPMEVCPYDSNHRVPRRSLDRHTASCKLSQMGYSREEQEVMYNPSAFHSKAEIRTISVDKNTQQQVILQARASAPPIRMEGMYSQSDYSADPPDVPLNHTRAMCDLTVADRLALYDHVRAMASQQKDPTPSTSNDDLYVDLVAKLQKGDEQNGPKSHLEVLAEMRDYKRRRQSYRAKNVHITKKSYTEVIREVIEVHSGELARVWQEEMEEEEEEEAKVSRPPSHRRKSEDQRSGSVESGQSRGSTRERHSSQHMHLRNQECSKEHSRGRERSQERSRGRERSQERSRGRERSQERSRGRERSQELSRGRERSQELSRGRERSQELSRGRERSQELSRGRERSQEHSLDRERSQERSRGRERSQERSRGRECSRERSRDRERSRERQRNKERIRERPRSRDRKSRKKRESRSPDERQRAKKSRKLENVPPLTAYSREKKSIGIQEKLSLLVKLDFCSLSIF